MRTTRRRRTVEGERIPRNKSPRHVFRIAFIGANYPFISLAKKVTVLCTVQPIDTYPSTVYCKRVKLITILCFMLCNDISYDWLLEKR